MKEDMRRRKAAASKKAGGVEVEIVGVPTQEELNSFVSTEAETERDIQAKKMVERRGWSKPNENFMAKKKSEQS